MIFFSLSSLREIEIFFLTLDWKGKIYEEASENRESKCPPSDLNNSRLKVPYPSDLESYFLNQTQIKMVQ